MTEPVVMAEVWRGPILECVHRGHAVVCGADGSVEHVWGDPDLLMLPRSACKMIQALPLVESGAATKHRLTSEHLALACASHNGAAIHTDRVQKWLADLDLTDEALRCGPQMPADEPARTSLYKTDDSPCQYHNNCSGKHSGFLTLTKHLDAGPEYTEPDHPVQTAVREATERSTGMPTLGHAIDGCSAPNFATTLTGLARGMTRFANAADDSAEGQLRDAMMRHPELVAGEGRACTYLMRAAPGSLAVKTGAEAVFTAILPGLKKGIALKIVDGATRASECAIAAILVKLGVLEAHHPDALRYTAAPLLNRRGIAAAHVRAAPALL